MEQFERRAQTGKVNSTGKKLSGIAARYNSEAQLPGFIEVLSNRCFATAVRDKQDVVALFNHNPNYPLARTSAGTLRLWEDSVGLNFECDLPDVSYANDLHTSIKRGDVSGVSFAFQLEPGDQTWEDRRGVPVRHINNVSRLQDISPCVFPVYDQTSVDARCVISSEVRSRLAEFDKLMDPMKITGDFVRETLGVSWLYESLPPNFQARSVQASMELSKWAMKVRLLREAGQHVEVKLDSRGNVLGIETSKIKRRKKTDLLSWALD